MKNSYFIDTYAIIEIIKGNKNYFMFKDVKYVLTIFNLFELHYALLRDYSETIAKAYVQYYSKFLVEMDLAMLHQSNVFKLENKKKKYSYADCVGYVMAKRLGLKFLTGDQGFSGVENVEYIK